MSRAGGVAEHAIGIDLGGTKIEGIALDREGVVRARHRIAAPHGHYRTTISAIIDLVDQLECEAGQAIGIGIAIPGSISPASGLMQNANSTWLNGQPFDRDLMAALGRPVRLENDANCFAMSEAKDGAAKGFRSVFGVILGTGCGGGWVYEGRLAGGPRGICGEWGHNPLPWADSSEFPGAECWCGRRGCLETWISGPAMAHDHLQTTHQRLTAEEIGNRSTHDADCAETLAKHAGRVARGLAHVVNILDPDVIVLGGGLSRLGHLYRVLPGLMAPYVFADSANLDIRPPVWGDASGVRGAARLWQHP